MYNQKPQLGSQINWTHPLTRGLVGCWLLNEDKGNRINDLAGSVGSGALTGTPDWSNNLSGSVLRCDNDQYVTFASKLTAHITDKFTVIWWGTPVQLTSTRRKFFVGQYQAVSASGWNWGLYINASPYTISFYTKNAGASGIESASTSTLAVDTEVCVAGVYDGANQRIFYNGVQEDEDAQTGNVANDWPFYLGGTWSSSNYADVKTSLLLVFNRDLTAFEIAQLYREPFAIFEPVVPLMRIFPLTGSIVVVPENPASAVASSIDPTVVYEGVTVTPVAVEAIARTPSPTVVKGSITHTPSALNAIASVFGPVVVIAGDIEITPNPAICVANAYFVFADFTSHGKPFLYTASQWENLSFYLEVYMRATSGTAIARLYDITDEKIVDDSPITTDSSSHTRVRSGALTLTDGNVYRVQFGADGTDTGAFLGAKLIAA